MDLASLISNKPLLASLTREYELLKSTQADVNYEEWIIKRLKHAAASQQSSSSSHKPAAVNNPNSQPLPAVTSARQTPAEVQKSNTFKAGDLRNTQQPWAECSGQSAASGAAPQHNSQGAWVCAGEKPAGTPPLVKPMYEDWQAHDATNTQVQQLQPASTREPFRPVPLWNQPETSVDTSFKGHQRGSASQPQWVAAAKLQNSLQSSRVVPLMHAAAERERRLAATSALVRQQLAIGTTSNSSTALQQLLEQQMPSQPMNWHMADQAAAAAEHQQMQQQALQPMKHAPQQGQAASSQGLQQQMAHEQSEVSRQPILPSTPVVQTSKDTQQLHEVIQNSWLVKSVLQTANGSSVNCSQGPGQAVAPEFIRITGEAGNLKKQQQRKQAQQQQQQQQQQVPADRRKQLKSALKQLIAGRGAGGLGQSGAAGLLQALLGQQQQQQKGLSAVDPEQQQVLTDLQQAIQGRVSSSRVKQDARGLPKHSQDENLEPLQEEVEEYQETPQGSAARQQLLERRRQQQRQRVQAAASSSSRARADAAGGIRQSSRPLQQRQQQQRRPEWQSEPFVAPPSHLLRRKHSGFTDAWGLSVPAARTPAAARPTSAGSIGQRSSNKAAQQQQRHAASKSKSSSRKGPAAMPQHAEGQQQQRQQRLQQQQHGMDDDEFHDNAYAADNAPFSPTPQTRMGFASAPDRAADSSQWQGLGLPTATAAAAGDAVGLNGLSRPAAAAGMAGMSTEAVQQLEVKVKQQLQEEQQQEEKARLSRLEDTASHILGVLARLEQQLQPPSAAAGAGSGIAAPGVQQSAAAPAAEAAAGILCEPLVMSSMLSALDRIEAQEQEIRSRWFGQSEISARPPAGAAGAAGMGTVLEVKGGIITAYPLESTAGTSSTAAAGAGAAAATTEPPPPQQQQQQQQQPEVLSKASLKSIKAGKKRFLKHQSLVDGQLEVLDSLTDMAGGPQRRARQQLQPTAVVEAVADLLLDELLLGRMEELDGFCDSLCNQLFDDEFEEA